MTATDELRRLLDERGVKYRAWDSGVHPLTVWHDELLSYEYEERRLINGVKPHTGEVLDGTGRLSIAKHVCSPEQAIEATLWHGCAECARGMGAYADRLCDPLKAENAKLRELVDYMTPIAWYAASERERDRMRELGVEV